MSAATILAGDGGTGELTIGPGGSVSRTTVQVGAAGKGTVTLDSGGTLTADSVEVGGNGYIVTAGGTLDPPNTITINAGGKIGGFGTISGDITNDGEIDAAARTLLLSGAVSGTGDVVIGGSGALELQSALTDGTSFAAGATGTRRPDQAVPGPATTSPVSNIRRRWRCRNSCLSPAFTPAGTPGLSR